MIVWLASYPRSGNTYIRTILHHAFGVKTYSIHGDKLDIAADEATKEIVGHKDLPENFDYAEARQSGELYFIKTHAQYNIHYAPDKAIYILRDGREATVSFYHYWNDFSQEKFSILEIINGHTFAGSWADHYYSWLREKKDSILLLRFEEMLFSPESAINKIAEFTCLTPQKNRVPGFVELHNVNPQFFRSGQKDSFNVNLTDFEKKYFWLVNSQAMRDAGYVEHIPVFNNPTEVEELFLKHVDLTQQRESKTNAEKMQIFNQQLRAKEQIIENKDSQLQRKEKQIEQKGRQIQEIKNSYSFKVGQTIISPFSMLKSIFLKLKIFPMNKLKRLDRIELNAPILIYQMGKVGSSSVFASLKKAGIPNSIIHIHQLSDEGIKQKERWFVHHKVDQPPLNFDDLTYIKKIKHIVETNRKKHEWKIISLTRDPISLEFSAFFENIHIYSSQVFNDRQKPDKQKILDYFYDYFTDTYDPENNYFLNWFDNEMKAVFGIDVYSQPFDFSKGYAMYKKDSVSLLIIRMEDLNRVFTAAIHEFLNIDGIKLVKENLSSNKEYDKLYRDVINETVLPDALCEKMYSSKYATHFYSKEERDTFLDTFAKKVYSKPI